MVCNEIPLLRRLSYNGISEEEKESLCQDALGPNGKEVTCLQTMEVVTLVTIFSFLHHDGISGEIFHRAWKTLWSDPPSEWTLSYQSDILLSQSSQEWDIYPLRAAVSILLSYSLITRNKDHLISIHPLVHTWTRDRLSPSDEETTWTQTTSTVALSIPWTFKTVDYRYRKSLVPKGPNDSEIHAATFVWDNLFYDVKVKGGSRRLLDNAEGWFGPGTLTALMCASGEGKTTLLNVLANRVSTGVVGGEKLVDAKYQDEGFARKVGYAQQQDMYGRSIYFGDIGLDSQTLIDYFHKQGARGCGTKENPAEWLLDITGSAQDASSTVDWPYIWQTSQERQRVKDHLRMMKEALSRSVVGFQEISSVGEFASSFADQLYRVIQRNFEHDWRTPSYLYSKVFLTFGAVCIPPTSAYEANITTRGSSTASRSINRKTAFKVSRTRFFPFFFSSHCIVVLFS